MPSSVHLQLAYSCTVHPSYVCMYSARHTQVQLWARVLSYSLSRNLRTLCAKVETQSAGTVLNRLTKLLHTVKKSFFSWREQWTWKSLCRPFCAVHWSEADRKGRSACPACMLTSWAGRRNIDYVRAWLALWLEQVLRRTPCFPQKVLYPHGEVCENSTIAWKVKI